VEFRLSPRQPARMERRRAVMVLIAGRSGHRLASKFASSFSRPCIPLEQTAPTAVAPSDAIKRRSCT
jgi:hypothetical protein